VQLSKIIPLLVFFFLFCSNPAHRGQTGARIGQRVLFQQSFINYAWGYQNRGWFVDNDGEMKAYRIAGRGDQWHNVGTAGTDSGYIVQKELEENYAKADWVIYHIPQSELIEKFRLISSAANGPYSPYTRAAYDAGNVLFCAYLLDKEKGAYGQVLLERSGDFSQFNENADAQEIQKWLVGLNQIYADSLAGK